MDPLLASTLLKLIGPLGGIVLLLIVVRLRGLSLRDDVGLAAPRATTAALWLAAWIALMAVEEWAINTYHLEQAKPWPAYSPLIVALRVAAIGLAGPACEELIFRGALLGRLRHTRLGVPGALLLTAAIWAAFHLDPTPAGNAMLVLDGVVLGMARLTSRSVWVPIVMHVLGNLFSIWQSTHG